MKIKFENDRKRTYQIRDQFKQHYINKFFNKWMNKFKFEGLNYQQIDYIMRKFWDVGSVAVSKPVGLPNNLGLDDDYAVVFTPWVMAEVYNIYDWPTMATAINTRGVPFINVEPQLLDEGIVIIYCQRNKKGIYSSIEAKLNELVDIEMILRIALKTTKFPWLFTTTPENKTAVEKLAKDLESDEPTLFTTLEESEKGKGFTTGASYVADKLEQMRQKVEDDIMTILGVQNVGIAEKKEHLIVGEVEANNQAIEQSDDEFLQIMQEGFERANKVFNKKVVVSLNKEEEIEYNNGEEEDNNVD